MGTNFVQKSIDPDAHSGAAAHMQVLLACMRLPFIFVSAVSFGILKLELWPLYVSGPILSLAGVYLGNLAHDKVDSDSIVALLRVFIIAGTLFGS